MVVPVNRTSACITAEVTVCIEPCVTDLHHNGLLKHELSENTKKCFCLFLNVVIHGHFLIDVQMSWRDRGCSL